MTRRLYGNGHTLTGLREWARELAGSGYPVKGYTRMDGDTLAAAIEATSRTMRRDLEMRNMVGLMGRPLVPGMLLIAECGCRIVATTGVLTWEGDDGRYANDPSLYAEGDYVQLCPRCAKDHPAGPEHLNATQDVCLAGPMGRRFRFFLHNHTVVDSDATVERVEHGDLREGDIVHEYGMRVRIYSPKHYPHPYRAEYVPCTSWAGDVIGGTHPYGRAVSDSEGWTVQSVDRGVWRTRERCLCPVTDLVESGMSDCRSGCKTFTCPVHRSEAPRVIHNATYGCRTDA